jgi:glycine oxidase
MQDVIIIGGGVIGLSLACELAREGLTVAVVDRGQMGQESSWAGAGILPPGNPRQAATPEARLRALSHVLWPEFSARLADLTGIDNGFRRCGGLEVRFSGRSGELDDEIEAWRQEGVTVEPLSSRSIGEFENQLHPEVTSAYRLPEMGQVRNPRHLKALSALCDRQGVVLAPGVEVLRFERSGTKIVAVETSSGKMSAAHFVIAGGAWSEKLLADVGCCGAVRPLRGQMVLLALPAAPIRHVVNIGHRYLVPRDDGRVLAGATEEVAGFEKRTTACGVGDLVKLAARLVPALARATFERAWSGLRPQSADGLPYLGGVPQFENLFAATGHFRAGLQLSPATALVLSQAILGRETAVPLAPYSPGRHSQKPSFPELHDSPVE